MTNTDTVKGFKDYTGQEAIKRQIIKGVLIENFEKYGFLPAETPVIEYEEFVKGDNPQDEAVSDIYKLQDKGKRKLALRYEFTFQLKRIAKNKKLPFKRYQLGEVFRDEPVSSTRFRQFTQADADIVGSTIKDEAEILALASKILDQLGIKAEININNRKLLNEILQEAKITNKKAVIKELDKLDKLPKDQIKTYLKKYKAEKVLNIVKNKAKCKKYQAYKEIQELEKYCKLYKVNVNFQPSLARGLSYYTGSIFEIKSKDVKETICAGGSYNVNNTSSTGISFGLDRLSHLAQVEVEDTSYLIISIDQDKAAIALAEKLRKADMPCQIYYGKISKALEYANSLGILNVIFLGKEEIKKKKLKLKNMKTGKESFVSEKELLQ